MNEDLEVTSNEEEPEFIDWVYLDIVEYETKSPYSKVHLLTAQPGEGTLYKAYLEWYKTKASEWTKEEESGTKEEESGWLVTSGSGGSVSGSSYTLGEVTHSLSDAVPDVYVDVLNPVTHFSDTLLNVIIQLNDQHDWTREQIADWLDTLDLDLSFKCTTDQPKGNT